MNRTRAQYYKERQDIENKWFDEWHELGGPGHERPNWEYQDEWNKLKKDWLQSLEIGDRVHINMYSDVIPATIIKRTAKSITVRHDKGELDPTWKPEFIVGGFAGHCTNQDSQRWNIEEDLNGRVERFNWSEKYGVWKNSCDETLWPEWEKYYDYNF